MVSKQTGASKQAGPTPVGQIEPVGEAVADPQSSGPRQVIEQAARDVAHGLKDTDRHGIPSDVPGPGADQPQEADVPPQGGGTRHYGERQMGRKSSPK